jgi:sigma-B regulation protein RsbU (phosphoserine phosphatase)
MKKDESLHQLDHSDELQRLQSENNLLKKDKAELANRNRELREKLDACDKRFSSARVAHENEQALRLAELIIDNSPAILFRRRAGEEHEQRMMVYVSPNISRFGYKAEDFVTGKMMFRDIVYPGDDERLTEEIDTYVKNNDGSYSQTYRIVTSTGEVRWIEDQTSVVVDEATGERFHQGIVIDIHERKVAEESLRKSEEKYRRIVETAGEGFLLMDRDLNIVDLNSAFARMVGSKRDDLLGKKPFESGNSRNNGYQEFWSSTEEVKTGRGYREFECEIQHRDGQAVPVLVHANTLRSDNDEIIGNMAFVTDMTDQKKALSLAGEVQRSLLPESAPQISGFDIAGKNIPCDEVGGDYFDYLWEEGAERSKFSVVVGDISGHGVDSALLMSSARAFLRMRASHPGTITDIVTAMNQHLTEDVSDSGRFMTLLYLTMDREQSSFEWIRAGHDPAWLYNPLADEFEELKGPGLALGIDHGFSYQVQQKSGLEAGQVIIVGTDGIWEGCNQQGEMFGKQRVQEIIRKHSSASAEDILDRVMQEHFSYCQGARTEDDLTLVIVKILE